MKKNFTMVLLVCFMVSLLSTVVFAAEGCTVEGCPGTVSGRDNGELGVVSKVPCLVVPGEYDKKIKYYDCYVYLCNYCGWEEHHVTYSYTMYVCEY